jgi:putative ABC transport system permease protein
MWRDIRHAALALKRSPIFTLSATLALGLAIGANATIFGLVDGLWFRPPGVRAPGDFVRVFSTTAESSRGTWSYPEYLALRDSVPGFAGTIARGRRGVSMAAADGRSELLLVNVVTTNFFSVLGVKAAYGRLFAPGDEPLLDAQPGVILGHAFWRRRFGGDPSIVGRTIAIGRGTPIGVVVLAVLPETFRDLDAAADRDLWLPEATWVRLTNRGEFEDRAARWFDVLARRRPGVTTNVLSAQVGGVAASLAAAHAATNAGRGAFVMSDLAYRLDAGGANALALVGLVLLVVVITCVNLANLLFARAAAQARELAMRVALGASRWRMLRYTATESALVGAAGALAGITIALWLIRLLPAILVQPPGFRSLLLFQADARVFGFTLAVSVVTTLLFGTAPGWIVARTDVAAVVKGETQLGATARADRVFRSAMVIAQIAVSLVLLCSAGLLARSFLETRRANLGITRSPVLTAWVTARNIRAPSAREAVARLEALPGVTRVAVAIRAPLSLSGGGLAQRVWVPGLVTDSGAPPEVKYTAVSANYFETIGTRIVRGRAIADEDERGEPVVVVNERFADRYFPGSDALGRSVRLGRAEGVPHRIVGIAENAVINEIGEAPEPYLYLPFWRGTYGEVTYLVATAVDASELAGPVRETLKRTDPSLTPDRVIALAQYVEYSAGTYQATAALAVALAVLGLLLTSLGVYGVIAYRTSRRTREIGIRLALGAERPGVVRLLFSEGARLGLVGIGIGLALMLAVSRLLTSLLFGVRPWDALSFGAAVGVLAVTVSLAILIPAWRATRVMPSVALRDI